MEKKVKVTVAVMVVVKKVVVVMVVEERGEVGKVEVEMVEEIEDILLCEIHLSHFLH